MSRDPAVRHSHVGRLTGRPCPVDNRPTPNDHVSAHGTIVAALTPPCTPRGGPSTGVGYGGREEADFLPRNTISAPATACDRGSDTWVWDFQGASQHPRRSTGCKSRAPSWPLRTGPPRRVGRAGHAPLGLGLVRDQYMHKVRRTRRSAWCPVRYASREAPVAVRGVRQRRGTRA